MGSERPFLFPTHPHEETSGKEEMKWHQLWASKEGSSRSNGCSDNASLLLTHALGQGVGGRVLDETLLAGLLLAGYPVGAKPRAQQRCIHRSNTAVDVGGKVHHRDERQRAGGRIAGE